MRKIALLLLVLSTYSFVNAQSSIGLHFGTGFPHSSGPLSTASDKDRISFSPGIDYRTDIGKQLHFYVSLGALSLGKEYELRWGAQYDGLGNYIPPDPLALTRSSVISTDFFLATQVGIKYYLTDKKVSLFVQPYLETDFLIIYQIASIRYLGNGSVQSESVTTSVYSIDKPLVYTLAAGVGSGLEIDIKESFSLYVMPEIKILTTAINSPFREIYIIPSVQLGILYKL